MIACGQTTIIGRRREIHGRKKSGQLIKLEIAISRCVVGGVDYYAAILRDITERSRQEQAARTLNSIVSLSDEAIFSVSADMKITSWNQGASRIYLYSAAQATQLPLEKLFPPHLSSVLERIKENVLEGYNLNQFETLQLRQDGTEFDAEMSFAPHLDNQQRVAGISIIARDISLAKSAQQQLRDSEERFRQLAENINEVFWLRTANTMLYVSPAYVQIWGRSCESLYSNPNSFIESIHPADRESVLRWFNSSTQLPSTAITEFEYRIVRPDGTTRWIKAKTFPVKSGKGEPRFAGVAEDITERKLADIELERSRNNLAKAEQLARVGYWSWNINTNEIDWSDEIFRIFGFSPGEFQPDYATYVQYVHPDDLELTKQKIAEAIEQLVPFSVMHRIVTRQGETRYVHALGEVEKGEDGKPAKLFGVVYDINAQKRAELALQESEERFRSMFEQSATGMAVTDPGGYFLRANRALLRLLGYSQDELLGMHIRDITHPEDVERDLTAVDQLVKGESDAFTIEKRYLGKDGRVIHGLLTGSTVRDADGQPLYLVGQILDIGERKLYEDELKRSRDVFAIAENMAGLGSWDMDHTTNRVVWSDETYRLFGHEPQSFVPLYNAILEQIHPADVEKVKQAVVEAIAGNGLFAEEFRIVRPDGTERTITSKGRVYYGEDGKPVRTTGMQQDITVQRGIESALRQSEERYRLLAQHSSDMISKHTLDGTYIYVSEASKELLGYTEKDLLATNAYDYFHPDDLAVIRRSHEGIVNHPDTQTARYRIRRQDGSYMWFETTSRTVRNLQTGEPEQIVAVSRDISQRVAIEQRLRSSEERFRMLAQSALEGIAIHMDGVVVECNEALARMYQLPREELIGSDVLKLIHPEDVHISLERIRRKQSGSYEVRGQRLDGSEFPVLITAQQTVHRNEPARVVVLQDLTERAAYEKTQRESAARAAEIDILRKTAATYAHEINNPLTGILATFQMLQSEVIEAELQELVGDAAGAARRIKEVVERMNKMTTPRYREYLDREILDVQADEESETGQASSGG